MKQFSPAISVVLPVFNGGAFLQAAIESVLNQTFTNFELIILNDGSTDQSIQIIKHFAAKDSRIVVVDRENHGLVATLNEGIELARASVIARMDADDVCDLHRFEYQLAYLEANSDCVAVGSRVLLIDPDGLPIKVFVEALGHEDIDSGNMLGVGSHICHPTVMFRRDVALSIGGYREQFKYAEDVDFFLRLAEVGSLENLSEVLLYYRQHLNSVGYAYTQAQMHSARASVKEACRRRKLPIPSDFHELDTAGTVQTHADIHRKWAWWSISGGHLVTARKHALKAARLQPISLKSWKLALCVLRGY